MNVLIVDDLYEVVQGVVDGVNWKMMGIEKIHSAYSVDEAKDVFRNHQIGLLLCDIEMPPYSGFDLLQWMRANGYDAECIFLTSHAEFEYARRAVKLGSFDYILQPATIFPFLLKNGIVYNQWCVEGVLSAILLRNLSPPIKYYGDVTSYIHHELSGR